MICNVEFARLMKLAGDDTNHSSAIGSPLSHLVDYVHKNNDTKWALTNTKGVIGFITRERWKRNFDKTQMTDITRVMLEELGYDLAPKQGSPKTDDAFMAQYLAKTQ
jgi:hypothetical protein